MNFLKNKNYNYLSNINHHFRNVIKVFYIVINIAMVLGITACGNSGAGTDSLKSEDGRSYGGLIEGEIGNKINTVFFDFTVDSAKKYSIYQFDDGLYQADDGNTYLVVSVTITNTYDKDLPMSIADFTLDFSGNESEEPVTGFGSVKLNDEDFMDNIYTLKIGDTITKSILFTVPDKAEYFLCYKEYYEDKFEGDSYEVSMVPVSDDNELSIDASVEQNDNGDAGETNDGVETNDAGEINDGVETNDTGEANDSGESNDGGETNDTGEANDSGESNDAVETNDTGDGDNSAQDEIQE